MRGYPMMHSSKNSTGFSLVEMLVSMMIGIFIILGAGVVYNNSRQTFEIRDAVAAATESSRFAVQDMRRTLVMAGRGITTGLDDVTVYGLADNGVRTFPAVDANGTVAEDATGIVDEDSRGSSVIAIRYAEGPAPCGKSGTITANTTVSFFVNADNELVCDDGIDPQPLVSGVARMRALYGVDSDADDYANTYWTATQVENNSRWVNVVAIRIGMIMNSGEVELPRGTVLSDEQTLSLLGSDYDVPEEDNRLYHKSVSTTFFFRNKHSSIESGSGN